MLSLGIDIGTSTVKLVLLKNQEIEKQWMAVHYGNPFVCLKKGLSTLELAMDTPFSLCMTGSNTEALLEQDSAIPSLGDIPAIVEGVRQTVPQAGSVIEIGSQGARFITDLQSRALQFAVNEHCAGGTGSFFEDQMSRVGCRLGDYSSLVEQAQSVPRLSGRCAVFDFYKQADKLLLEGYTGKRDPRKKTVGVPFALMIHKFFPMANAFFTSLGFNVVLTDPTSEETIRLAQQTAQGETCYPVKLIYGHMQQLIDQKVDYIFLPTIHTMKHEKGCSAASAADR